MNVGALLASEDSGLKTLAQSYNKLGLGAMNVDLWVNAQNLPVRMEESTSASSSIPLKATVDYSDYSTSPVTVTPPAASDTLDMSSMLPNG